MSSTPSHSFILLDIYIYILDDQHYVQQDDLMKTIQNALAPNTLWHSSSYPNLHGVFAIDGSCCPSESHNNKSS